MGAALGNDNRNVHSKLLPDHTTHWLSLPMNHIRAKRTPPGIYYQVICAPRSYWWYWLLYIDHEGSLVRQSYLYTSKHMIFWYANPELYTDVLLYRKVPPLYCLYCCMYRIMLTAVLRSCETERRGVAGAATLHPGTASLEQQLSASLFVLLLI